MDFFQHQDRARRNSFWMILIFSVGVLCVACAITGIAYALFYDDIWKPKTPEIRQNAIQMLAYVFGGTMLLILGASFVRSCQLKAGGGRSVAEAMNGRLVENPKDLKERQLLNIVEEIALASGMPLPLVYVLDNEPGINAFAAGNSPEDAVVAVTRGTLDFLNREELQGVIAHEFSHIYNGDMRINIRLMGFLFGIYLIYLIGAFVLRSTLYVPASSSQDKESGAGKIVIFLLALGVAAIGLVGYFFGNVIKAMLSRQREYLADASAVQFTRNPNGISNALKKIGGIAQDDQKIQAPAAEEASHLFFSNFSGSLISSLLATHPPLEDRIRRLDPKFNPALARMMEQGAESSLSDSDSASGLASGFASAAGTNAYSGTVSKNHLGVRPGKTSLPRKRVRLAPQAAEEYAIQAGSLAELLTEEKTEKSKKTKKSKNLPKSKRTSLADKADRVTDHVSKESLSVESVSSFSTESKRINGTLEACAYVLALLTDSRPEIREKQEKVVAELMGGMLARDYSRMCGKTAEMKTVEQFMQLQLAVPVLRQLSLPQYRQFQEGVRALIDADSVVDLREFVIYSMVCRQLDLAFGLRKPLPTSGKMTVKMFRAAVLVLSRLAYAGSDVQEEQERAFRIGLETLNVADANLLPRESCSNDQLQKALSALDTMEPSWKREFLAACERTIQADGIETEDEAVLHYGISAALGIYGE